jgi:hypothetical protein
MACKILLAILAAGSLSGCGNSAPTQAEQDRKAEDYAKSFGVDASVSTRPDGTKSVVIERNAGGLTSQAGSNLGVSPAFPKDIPVYPQLNIFTSGELPNQVHMLQGQSTDSADRIAEFYVAQMKTNGWTEQPPAGQAPGMRTLQFQKGNRTASINLITGQGTTIQIMASAGG